MKKLIKNEKDLENLADEVLTKLSKNKYKHATVLALQGDLGTGKTTFTKILAKKLGITTSITSPTFVIQKYFDIDSDFFGADQKPAGSGFKFKKLIHIDSYRLDLSSELIHLGWHDNLNQKENLIVVEWPERIADILPAEYILLKFAHVDPNTREVDLSEEKK